MLQEGNVLLGCLKMCLLQHLLRVYSKWKVWLCLHSLLFSQDFLGEGRLMLLCKGSAPLLVNKLLRLNRET